MKYSHSVETKKRISIAHAGKKLTLKHRRAISKGTLGKPGPWKGKKFNSTHIQNLKFAQRNRNAMSGNWKGGSQSYWKMVARYRDNFTCQICGLYDIDIMEVDHILPTILRPDLSCELQNLLTLCPNCHARKTLREFRSGQIGNKRSKIKN